MQFKSEQTGYVQYILQLNRNNKIFYYNNIKLFEFLYLYLNRLDIEKKEETEIDLAELNAGLTAQVCYLQRRGENGIGFRGEVDNLWILHL